MNELLGNINVYQKRTQSIKGLIDLIGKNGNAPPPPKTGLPKPLAGLTKSVTIVPKEKCPISNPDGSNAWGEYVFHAGKWFLCNSMSTGWINASSRQIQKLDKDNVDNFDNFMKNLTDKLNDDTFIATVTGKVYALSPTLMDESAAKNNAALKENIKKILQDSIDSKRMPKSYYKIVMAEL